MRKLQGNTLVIDRPTLRHGSIATRSYERPGATWSVVDSDGQTLLCGNTEREARDLAARLGATAVDTQRERAAA